MPLPFNKVLDLKLLNLVKGNPILYDPSNARYQDFDSREVVWQKIGDILGRPAIEFAAIQCQIHFGDFQEDKHKPGLLENLNEYLPEQYASSWGAEKKILKLYRKHHGLDHLEAKHLYIKTARDLPTYGVTFFVVKEQQKSKKKLVPRLLGINAQAILRLDEVTKEILQEWPLTHVKMYHVGKHDTFTLNFGDYSEKEYSVKTNDALRIRDILEGYIDLIRRRLCGPFNTHVSESGVIGQENVHASRGNMMTHVAHNSSKVVEQSFVGPTKILPFEQGSKVQQGTQVMTVQQVIVTNKGSTHQQVISGEVPIRSDMSLGFVKKLNGMNANAVKIVTLLTEPNPESKKEVQRLMAIMEESMPDIKEGVKEAATKQTSDEEKKKLLSQLEELCHIFDDANKNVKSENMDTEKVQDDARMIADLTTQIYFSLDPRTRKRSEFCRRSRKSFIEDEKTEKTLRRASFIASIAAASHAIDSCLDSLNTPYNGPAFTDQQLDQLEISAGEKLSKLNSAIALFLVAHSDPKNIDYSAAVNSMNTIKELLPELVADAKVLASVQDGKSRQELMDEIQAMCNAARAVCMLTGCDDRGKFQEATSNYADVSGRLVYVFGGRNPKVSADKENEIMELAKQVGDCTTLLLMKANELTEEVSSSGDGTSAEAVDNAGVGCAEAARDLLACAQLTAPTIHEPHCQSALTAAGEGLSSAAQRLALTWKPLVDTPQRHQIGEHLTSATMDLAKALDRLKQAYANLGNGDVDMQDADADVFEVSPEEAQRLRFIATVNTARSAMKTARDDLGKPITPSTLSAAEANDLQDNVSRKMAQVNASVASLLRAKHDPQHPDHETAELAVNTIAEVIPEAIKDSRAWISTCNDARSQQMLVNDIRAWCDGIDAVCASSAAGDAKQLDDATKNFARASKKLSFVFSPHARSARDRLMMELFDSAQKQALRMVDDTNALADTMGGASGGRLRDLGQAVEDSARSLQNTLLVASPTLEEPRCRSALAESSSQLAAAAARLVEGAEQLQDDETGCRLLAARLQAQRAHVTQHAQRLQQALDAIRTALHEPATQTQAVESPTQKSQRLKFIASASTVREKAQGAERLLEQPVAVKLNDQQAKELENKVSQHLADVNCAIAALINAKTNRQNPNYESADQAVETLSDLLPEILNEAKILSSTCKTEADKQAMLRDIQAWCDAIQRVCAHAGEHEITDFVDSAQEFANRSEKLSFVFSPRHISDDEQQIMQLSSAACEAANQMVDRSQSTADTLPAADSAALRLRSGAVRDTAQALRTTAQLTAPTVSEANSRALLESTAEALGGAAHELSAHCAAHTHPRGNELAQQLAPLGQQMDQAIQAIKDTCQTIDGGAVEDPATKAQRMKFIASSGVVRDKLASAGKSLDQPISAAHLDSQQANKVEQKLSRELAEVNAAVARLVQARADPRNPDYNSADQALDTISEVIPEAIKDSRALISTCNDKRIQQALLNDIRAWCDGIDSVCASSTGGDAKQLDESMKKFAQASKKLSFVFSPRARNARDQLMLELFDSAQKQAMRMVDDTNALADTMGGASGGRLRDLGHAVEDSARSLKNTLLVASPTLEEPRCRSALAESSSQLAAAAARLVEGAEQLQDDETGCRLLAARLQAQRAHVTQHAQRLQQALDAIRTALHEPATQTQAVESPTQKSQRLKFIASASTVREKAQGAERLLEQPVAVKLNDQQAKELETKVSQRLADVNSAIATLIHAKTNRENPNYEAADEAIETVSDLLPQILNETKILSSTCKDEAAQQAMIRDIRAWCDAIQQVCAHAGEHEITEFVDSAQEFTNASNRLSFVFTPRKISADEQQVIQLSKSAYDAANQMVDCSESTAEALPGTDSAALHLRSGHVRDAAQALRTTAQLTAPSISEASSRAVLESTADALGGAAHELAAHCAAHSHPRGNELAQQLAPHSQQLVRAIQDIKDTCQAIDGSAVENPAIKAQRMKFIASSAVVRDKLGAAEKSLRQPISGAHLEQGHAKEVEEKLSRELAQVNAAVAELVQAKSDTKYPDYLTADHSINTIVELVPVIVNDTKALSSTCKDEATREAMVKDMQAWLMSTNELCAAAEISNHEELDKAAQNYTNASSKLKFCAGTHRDPVKEQEVLRASNSACQKAQQMAQEARRVCAAAGGAGGAAAPVLQRADILHIVARTLKHTALLTAPSINDHHSKNALVPAAESLSTSARQLVAEAQRSRTPGIQLLGEQLLAYEKELDASVQSLKDTCANKKTSASTLNAERQKFIASAATAQNKAKEAAKLLTIPIKAVKLSDQETKDAQDKVSIAMGEINAALAALIYARSDSLNPDYASAEQSLLTISEFMPYVVKESRALSTTCKDEAVRQAMLKDLHSWCDAVQKVCAAAAEPDTKDLHDSAISLSNASQKLRSVVSARQSAVKEQQIIQMSTTACDKAQQMSAETHAVAKEMPAGDADLRAINSRADALSEAATALRTTAQLTASSISSPQCQQRLLCAADAVSSSGRELVRQTSRGPHPAMWRLAEELDRYRELMEKALQGLKHATNSDNKRARGAPPAVPMKRSSLSRCGSGAAAAAAAAAALSPRVRVVSHSNARRASQEWLDHMRKDSSADLANEELAALTKAAEEQKRNQEKLQLSVQQADKTIQLAEDEITKAYDSAANVPVLNEEQCEAVQQQMEHKLSVASNAAARLLAANHPEKTDYATATQSVDTLSEMIPDIVKDGVLVANSVQEQRRRAMLDKILALCQATRKLVARANNKDIQEVNEAAVKYGNSCAALVYDVCKEIDPAQEKEVMSRTKAVVSGATLLAAGGAGCTRDVRAAARAARLAAAAGGVLYGAKLLGPSIHHQQCQNTLITSSHGLSSELKTFAAAIKHASSDPQHASDVAMETAQLETLLEAYRQDLAAGKMVKRRQVEKIVVEDTALRQLATEIMAGAQMRAECSNVPKHKKEDFIKYANKLRDAIRALDVANHRCKRAPTDLNRRQDLDNAVQNLQIIALQSRPTLGDQAQNNIVDLTDFVREISTEVEKLLGATTKIKSKEDKKELDVIKEECQKINANALKLLNPAQDGDNEFDDVIMEVDQFGQDCEKRIQWMKSAIESLSDKGVKVNMQENIQPLVETCNLLRFASKSALSTTQNAALDATLNDLNDLEKRLDKLLLPVEGSNTADKNTPQQSGSASGAVSASSARVSAAAGAVCGGCPQRALDALTGHVAVLRSAAPLHDAGQRNKMKDHVGKLIHLMKTLTAAASTRVALWEPLACPELAGITNNITQELAKAPLPDQIGVGDSQTKVLNEADINKLLMALDGSMEGVNTNRVEPLQQSAGKVMSVCGTVLTSATSPAAMSRAAPLAVQAARTLADSAIRTHPENSMQRKRTAEAAQEMCWAMYQVLRCAEVVARQPGSAVARRRLDHAAKMLADSVNRLTRTTPNGSKLSGACHTAGRALRAASASTAAAQPVAAPPYHHVVKALQDQQDLIHKLKNDEPQSRKEFGESLDFIVSAVCNSAEYAAQTAYLISISERHKDMAKEGLVDVARLEKLSTAAQDSCFRIIRATNVELVKDEEGNVTKLTQELHQAIKEASSLAKDGNTKRELTECAFKVDLAAKTLTQAIGETNPSLDKIQSCTVSLTDSIGGLGPVLERPGLVPPVGTISKETKALADDIMAASDKLVRNTQSLVEQVKGASGSDEDDAPMTWVTFNTHRTSVVDAFEALLNKVTRNGELAGIVEVAKAEVEDETDAPKKSYVQLQEEIVLKWLQRRPSNAGVQHAGEEALRNIIDVAVKMTEDMKDNEREELQNLIEENRELLAECSKKYDNDAARSLADRTRELRRAVERAAVTRAVEDALLPPPLEDLDIFVDAETDESKRKFLLEKKIAELMSQLGRVSRTARLLARAGPAPKPALQRCTEQVELLAPQLVQAATERVTRPDDAAALQRYRALLAEYVDAMSQVRVMCDEAVDPMDYVQTAGETMSRMREESSQHNDPQLCAYTSNAITRLANRVIVVSMSSRAAREDADVRAALAEARGRLDAAAPANARASRLPDWKDTTAEILRTTGEVESALGGENIFKKLPEPDQPIYTAALSLHAAVREWSARDNEIVAVAKRMAVLMARLSEQMHTERKRELIATSKSIVTESRDVAALAKKLANECTDVRIRTNLLQVCERIPTISGQLKMLTVVKGSSLGNQGGEEDREAMNMLVCNAQNLMSSVQEVVKAAASATVKISAQRGLKWVRRNY